MISSGTIMKNAPTDIFDLSMAHTNDTPPPPKKKDVISRFVWSGWGKPYRYLIIQIFNDNLIFNAILILLFVSCKLCLCVYNITFCVL